MGQLFVYMADDTALLQNCNSKPVVINLATGQYFDYCSKSCATQAMGSGPSQSGSLLPNLCEVILDRDRARSLSHRNPAALQAETKV